MVSSSAQPLDRTFAALADPTRRALLAALTRGPRTVGDLAAPLPISLVAVIKHLAVLDKAGLVRRTRRGRTVLCSLRAAPLDEAANWIDAYRGLWEDRIHGLVTYLSSGDDQPAPTSTGREPQP